MTKIHEYSFNSKKQERATITLTQNENTCSYKVQVFDKDNLLFYDSSTEHEEEHDAAHEIQGKLHRFYHNYVWPRRFENVRENEMFSDMIELITTILSCFARVSRAEEKFEDLIERYNYDCIIHKTEKEQNENNDKKVQKVS